MSDARIEAFIRQFALADHLNPDLLRCLRLMTVPVGEEIYAQTDEQISLYLLVAGKVQVRYDHPNGKEAILAFMTPLALIGDVELFSQSTILSTVQTSEASTLLYLEKEFALRYGYDDPRFLRFVIQNLTAKLYGSSHVLMRQGLPLIAQVSAYLLSQSVTANQRITLDSTATLAALLGTTPRHLNRILKQLVLEGCITRQRNILQIVDRDRLGQFATS